MDAQRGLPEQAFTPPRRDSRQALWLVPGVLGILFLVIILCFKLPASPHRTFVWLTPAELFRMTRPGPLARLRYQLMNLTAPLWRWYWQSRPRITIRSSIVTLPAEAQPAGLGAPEATGVGGTCVWILSPAEWSALRQQFKTLPGATVLSSPTLSTIGGGQGQVSVANLVPVAGKPTPVGVTVDLIPKVVYGSVNLVVAVTSTETSATPAGNAVAVKTNFAVACRTVIPNGGGLVIRGANRADRSGTRYWLTVSPTATDARGNPLKP